MNIKKILLKSILIIFIPAIIVLITYFIFWIIEERKYNNMKIAATEIITDNIKYVYNLDGEYCYKIESPKYTGSILYGPMGEIKYMWMSDGELYLTRRDDFDTVKVEKSAKIAPTDCYSNYNYYEYGDLDY